MGAISAQAKKLKVSETVVRVMKRNGDETVEQYKTARKERKVKARKVRQEKHSKSKALRGSGKSAKKK